MIVKKVTHEVYDTNSYLSKKLTMHIVCLADDDGGMKACIVFPGPHGMSGPALTA